LIVTSGDCAICSSQHHINRHDKNKTSHLHDDCHP